jgi:hypothetical protein
MYWTALFSKLRGISELGLLGSMASYAVGRRFNSGLDLLPFRYRYEKPRQETTGASPFCLPNPTSPTYPEAIMKLILTAALIALTLPLAAAEPQAARRLAQGALFRSRKATYRLTVMLA